MKQTTSSLEITLVGITFIVLKLTGVIDWSWWWVTIPFWGGIALIIILLPYLLYLNKRIKQEKWKKIKDYAEKHSHKY